MEFEGISDWIGAHVDEMVDLQRELTARPALSPENGGAGEWQKARFLEDYLRQHGFEQIEHIDCPDDRVPEGSRPNFIASLPGPQDRPAVWVLTHVDVVPPGEQLPDGSWKGWDSDPYELQRLDEVLVGRGVVDNQQPMVSAVFAARALREGGVVPAQPVRLLFVSDEEMGSRRGLLHVLREAAGMFGPDDLFIVPDWGKEDGAQIEVAEKSGLWIEFYVEGRQAHASRPDHGINAFRAAAELVGLLDTRLRERFDRTDHLFDTPACTFEPTRHGANVPNVNTIPAEEVFTFDCRVLPSYDLDAVLACADAQCRRIDGMHGTTTRMEVLHRQDAPPPTRSDSEVVRRLTRAVELVYRLTPVPTGTGGMTVASPLRERGFQAAAWSTAHECAHQVNESCAIADMVGDARVFAHVFMG